MLRSFAMDAADEERAVHNDAAEIRAFDERLAAHLAAGDYETLLCNFFTYQHAMFEACFEEMKATHSEGEHHLALYQLYQSFTQLTEGVLQDFLTIEGISQEHFLQMCLHTREMCRDEPSVVDSLLSATDYREFVEFAIDFLEEMEDPVAEPEEPEANTGDHCEPEKRQLDSAFGLYTFPRSLKIGDIIYLTSCVPPASAGQWNIDFITDCGNKALHWSARPKCAHVVRNSGMGGYWGEDEMRGGWPFGQCGTPMSLVFSLGVDAWKIQIDGERVCEFDFLYRHSDSDSVTVLRITGALREARVDFAGGGKSLVQEGRGPRQPSSYETCGALIFAPPARRRW